MSYIQTTTPATRIRPDRSLPLPRAVLFDLDGTLIDSVPDITDAVAELLASEQLEPFSEMQVRRMVGHGLRGLVRRAYDAHGIALDEASLQHRIEAMAEIYPRHLIGRTRLMPGAGEALAFLAGSGAALAVVTNKLQGAAQTVLAHLGLAPHFDLVCGDGGVGAYAPPLKPAPDMLLLTLDRLGVEPHEALMVGDSAVDVQAARAAGITSVAIRGGYATSPLERHGPDRIIDDLAALPHLFA